MICNTQRRMSMALIICPECGKEISNKASVCIHCGYPLDDACGLETAKKESEENNNISDAKVIFEVSGVEHTIYLNRKQVKISILDSSHNYLYDRALVNEIMLCDVEMSTIGTCVVNSIEETDFGYILFLWWQNGIPYDKASLVTSVSEKEFAVLRKQHERAIQDALHSKQVLQSREKEEVNLVRCPKCKSTAIATINRGYSLLGGWFGSGEPINVCQKCGYRFEPGKIQ